MADITPDVTTDKKHWKSVFLWHLRQNGNVAAACREAGITREHSYHARKLDPAFATAWKQAMAEATDVLEAEARRRATEGVFNGYSKDENGTLHEIRRYSDTLLIFLLKAHRPKKYRDNARVEIGGRIESQTNVNVTIAHEQRVVGLVALYDRIRARGVLPADGTANDAVHDSGTNGAADGVPGPG